MGHQVVMDKSVGRRQPGVPIAQRRRRHWEFLRKVCIDPDLLRSSEMPPPQVQAALEDVMGPDRMANLKLRIHPLFRRPVLFERVRDPESGSTTAWAPVSIFMEDPKEDTLPTDYHDGYLRHLAGWIGEFRWPTKKDFEIIEKFDVRKYGYLAVDREAERPQREELKELQSQHDDMTMDFLEYHFWLAMRDAQAHYSQPWSTPEVTPHTSPARWKITQKDGYQVRERVWGDEGDKNEARVKIREHVDGKELEDSELEEMLKRLRKGQRGRIRITVQQDGSMTEEYLDEYKPRVEDRAEELEDLMRKRAAQKAAQREM